MTDVQFTRATSLVRGPRLREYFMEHVSLTPCTLPRRQLPGGYFWTVTKDLKGFKSASPSKIVSLVIPAGARIFAPPEVFKSRANIAQRKMRASKAIVHAIHCGRPWCDAEFGKAADYASSHFDATFIYRKGATVTPKNGPFSFSLDACSEGIHFFLNFYDAYVYR